MNVCKKVLKTTSSLQSEDSSNWDIDYVIRLVGFDGGTFAEAEKFLPSDPAHHNIWKQMLDRWEKEIEEMCNAFADMSCMFSKYHEKKNDGSFSGTCLEFSEQYFYEPKSSRINERNNETKGNKMKIELTNYNSQAYIDGSVFATMDVTVSEWEFTIFKIEEHVKSDGTRYFQYPNRFQEPCVAFDSLKINEQFLKEVEIAVDNLLSKRPLEPKKKRKYYDDNNRLQNGLKK